MSYEDWKKGIVVRLKGDGGSMKKLRRRVRDLEEKMLELEDAAAVSNSFSDLLTASHARLSQLYAHVMILEASVVTVSEDFNTAEEKEACASLGRSDASICRPPESPWCAYLAAYNDAVLEREAADPGVLAACGM
jgi:hypothetical protein